MCLFLWPIGTRAPTATRYEHENKKESFILKYKSSQGPQILCHEIISIQNRGIIRTPNIHPPATGFQGLRCDSEAPAITLQWYHTPNAHPWPVEMNLQPLQHAETQDCTNHSCGHHTTGAQPITGRDTSQPEADDWGSWGNEKVLPSSTQK